MLGGWVKRVGRGSTSILESKGIKYGSNVSRFIAALIRRSDKVKYHIPKSEQVNPLTENRHYILRIV